MKALFSCPCRLLYIFINQNGLIESFLVNCVSDSPDGAFQKVANPPNGWGSGCAVAGVFRSQICRQEHCPGMSSPRSSKQEHGDTHPHDQPPTKSHSKASERAAR